MNEETAKILSEQDKLRLLTEHDGWATVKALLMGTVVELQSIDGIDTSSPENVVIDIKSRQIASKKLLDWLREIEGTVEQGKTNDSLLPKKDSYIVRGDN